ncbi:type I polyketide synthase [Flavimaricola marinus]|uniref:Phenolphthiocerol synthesis polyketide synthase type I Pks15/1 n=1 Tax=Flavimaricola marinus TaxID=1819565 RepID=A0A238LIN1_9RHOB|nr:type I polyketide synthase [Flavimaricola marinus]SMY09255.1 Phenolphthiocerol synthesis polyketide synthase type I Pks15/1 [Flavimaricola marinus]
MTLTPNAARSPRATERGDIAIVGMACLFPGADTPQRFFANICQKLEFITDPLPSWGAERYLNGIDGTLIPTVRGGYLGEAYAADIAQLGVMPSSVDGSEPDHFLALRIARAALEDAGALSADHARTGVVLGHSSYLHRGNAAMVQHGVVLDQTRELLAQLLPGVDPAVFDRIRAAMADQLPPFTADMAPGLVPNVMTGRIANRLDLRGPNYIIDAACSSAHLAVQAAMIELRAGRSDMMLAGGVNASISAEVYMVFNQLGALAGSGQVRPFSEGGDGTLMGEGLGVLALKRVEDALDAGDRIYAVLKGLGQSSDGKGSGILAPRMEGEMLAIERAMLDAGQDPAQPDIPGLIECHGTGIPLGDKTEVGALKGMFGARAENGLPVTAIGSVKSMIGHCIPAAGAAGLIKASLALYHKTLPPTLSDKIRTGLPVDETGLYVNTETRPWIAAPGVLRRAAVNAFGFGGINAHAILEEAPAAADEPTPMHWAEELFLLSADSPADLAVKARTLAAHAERHDRAPLAAIAQWAVANAGTGPARLALTASSRDDLIEKLGKAATRLEGDKPTFRLRSGVVAAAAPMGGKLAFIFPGEGAQYQGMLAEILTAFPEARGWFDFWDGLFPDRDMPPSASVFPPPTTLDAGLAKTLNERLFGLELGSESMFIAAQALMAVLTRLGISPDVVVGHSSGEHSALAAAGVFGGMGPEDRDDFATRIRSLNDLYQAIEEAGGIEGGALLTVGGVARDDILSLTEADPEVHLALDNCQHQAVLYGPRAKMEEVVETLRPKGGMCSFLPFDRPYHTPLFADVAEKVAGVYAGMDFRPPTLPIWSCATVQPMPADATEIRALAAYQWASRVRFTETVEALHDDGVKLFLEVGPSANLTGFVEDALKGRDAQALPLDSRRRGGLAHLLQSLGRLWVAGRDFNANALFDGRGLAGVDLAAEQPRDRKRPITNTLAYVRLPQEIASEISADLMASLGQGPAAQPVGAPTAPLLLAPNTAPGGSTAAPRPQTVEVSATEPASLTGEMGGYFGVMQQFLDMQGTVMEAVMGGTPMTDPAEWQPPLLHRVTVSDEGLTAESDFDPLTDPFIAQHVLYADEVSDTDGTLQALPVLPLAVSMEMVVEAAAVLTGQLAARLENVAARDWVAFDAGPATLTTTARIIPGEDTRVAVQLLRGEALLFEAEAVIEPGPDLPDLPPLATPRAPVWRDDQLYSTGMFHGPLFQGVASLTQFDEGGLDATLTDMPLDDFFGHGEAPEGLLLNPALLDQLGHVTAFWIAQGAGTDFSSFPSSIDRIDLGEARAEATAGATISGRIQFRDAHDAPTPGPAEARFLQGDFEAHLPDGTLLMRASGWRDRFFRVPHAFYEARFRPRDAWYGAPLTVFDTGPDVTVWQVPAFPHGFLEDAGGIWMRVLATTILSAAEREQWAAMPATGKRRRDWIVGRIALKEAARAWIAGQGGPLLLPADIEIAVAEGGKPFVDGSALGMTMPEISLSHAQGTAVAVASPPGRAAGIDMEFSGRTDPALLADGGFGAEELVLMNGTDPLIGWCAKEAAAKTLGSGLTGRPKSFVLTRIGAGSAQVQTPDGRSIAVSLAQQGDAVLALAVFGA